MDSTGLYLVGLGPGDLDLMTQKAVNLLQKMDCRFLEGYTATLPNDSENRLEEIVGPWSRAMRPEIENPKEILEMSKTQRVGIMVVGDPMQATTHVDLILRAKDLGIKTTVIPGISATTLAISMSGLQSYRFGRQVTIPFNYGDYLPTSPLEYIDANFNNNLHTLALLDLDPTGMGVENPTPMQPDKVVELLQSMHERLVEREGVVRESMRTPIAKWDGILLSDLGTVNQKVTAGNLEDLALIEGGCIHCLILPATLDELENEMFQRLSQDTQV